MYSERKQRLIEVFGDTQMEYTENPVLVTAVAASKEGTKFYDAGKEFTFLNSISKAGNVTVTKQKTFEAAMQLSNQFPGKKIAVLNFASATNPGGGVKNGSSAQEECLCRCSTLYPTLNRRFLWERYYDVNRVSRDVLHTDACIYSP